MVLFVSPRYYGSCCQNLCLVKFNKGRVSPVHIPEVGSLDLIQEIITSHYYCQDELTEAWCIQKWLFQLIEIRKNGHKCHITSERFIALLFRIHVNTGVDWRCGAHAQISELHRLPYFTHCAQFEAVLYFTLPRWHFLSILGINEWF